jgi:hypothetical protein
VAFVGFKHKLLARRVPDGAFYDLTPTEAEGGIRFAAGWGRDVWVGTTSGRVIHARLTTDLAALERTLSVSEPATWLGAEVRLVSANQHGLIGYQAHALLQWSGSGWKILVPRIYEDVHHDVYAREDVHVSVAPCGALCFAHRYADGTAFYRLRKQSCDFSYAQDRFLWDNSKQDLVVLPRGELLVGGGVCDEEPGYFDSYFHLLNKPDVEMRGKGKGYSFLASNILLTYHWRIVRL